MVKYQYDISNYNFKKYLNKLFGNNLDEIKSDAEIFSRQRDQSTQQHKIFYEWAATEGFSNFFHRFIYNNIQRVYKEPIVYQSIPTFRIHFPNNIAVGEFHKDKMYRDASWAKEVKEDNFFLPITDAFDTNTIWVESEEDKGDFAPMNCKYGEFIKWDGSNLTHGNKINATGKTRISIDFRVIRLSNYKASEHGSINTGTKFKIGEYYKTL